MRTAYICTDPKANGHALCTWQGTTLPGQQTGGGMTEEQKAEQRTLVANNKFWDSAEKVRRSWMSESFLTRTTPPKGTETFLALAVAHGEHTEKYHRLGTRLTTDAEDGTPWDASSKIAAPGPRPRPRSPGLRVGVHRQPRHLAPPQGTRPPLPDRPHRMGLQALRRRAAHPRHRRAAARAGQGQPGRAGRGRPGRAGRGGIVTGRVRLRTVFSSPVRAHRFLEDVAAQLADVEGVTVQDGDYPGRMPWCGSPP